MKQILTLLLFLFTLSLFAQKPIEEAVVQDYDGNKFLLSDVMDEDKQYVVNIFATWCGWCIREWKDWSECIDDLKEDFDIEFLVIGTGNSSGGPIPKDGVNSRFSGLNLLDKVSIVYIDQDSLSDLHGVITYPTTYFFGTNKSFLDLVRGYQNCDAINNELSMVYGPVAVNDFEDFEAQFNLRYDNNFLTIASSGNESFEVEIFSLVGKSVFKSSLAQNEISVSSKDLGAPGLKVCKIQSRNKSFSKLIPVFY